MSYASDKLYNGYLRRRMPAIVSKVKVREIVVHLPCLTPHDREVIEAKRETNGNFDSMVLLLDCLRRRESWPEQFIQALQECEHPTIAAEIQAEYDTLRGVNNSSPGSPPTTVITAHVHPPPSASHLPVPETGGTAAAPSAETPAAPQGPAAPPTPPQETPKSPAAEQPSAPAADSPPEPVPEPPQAAQMEVAAVPSTPPPSPETSQSATESPPTEVKVRQEPEENSESDIQVISGDSGVIPDEVSAEALAGSATDSQSASPQVEHTVRQEPEENSEAELLEITGVIPDPVAPEQNQAPADSSPCETDTRPVPDLVRAAENTDVVGAAPEADAATHQEAEEISDIPEPPGGPDVIPDEGNAAQIKVVVDLVMTPPMSPCEKDTPAIPEPVRTSVTTEASPLRSPTSPVQEDADVSDESSFPILTPEKPPVQETGPTEDDVPAVVMQTEEETEDSTKEEAEEATTEETKEATEKTTEEATEETTEPPIVQVVEIAPLTEPVAAPSPLPDANGLDTLVSEDNSVFLSKPDVLLSTEPPNHVSPTLVAYDPPAEPYSGDSDRLEISDGLAPAEVPACAVATVVAEPPCQENGIALDHEDEPKENHCESSCPSLDSQEVLVNVVHVSEEPSIVNLQAQTPAPQIVNGEATKEAAPSSPPSDGPAAADEDDNPPSDHTCLPPELTEAALELKALQQEAEEKPAPRSNRKYYLTAAGVGACALLMAWKFKH